MVLPEDMLRPGAYEAAVGSLRARPKTPGPRVCVRPKEPIAPLDVERRLLRAMMTLRALPDREARFLRVGSGWPDYVREFMDAYGAVEAIVPRFRPSPADISDCLTALAWARHLQAHEWRVIWWRSFGLSFGVISERIGQSDETARRKYRNVLLDVWKAANAI
ncbi:DUF6362 family protein [Methylopila musalis]|uniref:DUF6362 family protein n=1 Tax=Methylopila musalis TaxID=1134781 RepID=A0ABW3Z4D2_9HYPH